MKAIVIGATGATGKDLVELLLEDPDYKQVLVFVRRDYPISHEKLIVHIIDFEKPNEWKNGVQGDVLFSCLGTTLKSAGSKDAQWKIDYDYQLEFAQIAKENGISTYVLVSSMMADPNSSWFYIKMKGQLEEATKALNFNRTLIFQPPSLIRENSDRMGEKLGVKLVRFLNLLGLMKNQKPLPTTVLAASMLHHSKQNTNGIKVILAKEIQAL